MDYKYNNYEKSIIIEFPTLFLRLLALLPEGYRNLIWFNIEIDNIQPISFRAIWANLVGRFCSTHLRIRAVC